MFSGKDGWGQFSAPERAQAAADVVRVLTDTRPRLNVFAAVVEQSQMLRTADILPYSYEVLAAKFDDYLARRYHRGDAQRGLFVLDQKRATEEKDVQALTSHLQADRAREWPTPQLRRSPHVRRLQVDAPHSTRAIRRSETGPRQRCRGIRVQAATRRLILSTRALQLEVVLVCHRIVRPICNVRSAAAILSVEARQ